MNTANRIAMTVAGAFLIVAGTLKSHQLLVEPIISNGFWESWLFFVIQIPLEFGLGIWLVCGLFRKVAWLLGTIAFGGFIVVSARLVLTGAPSCPCFGTIHVNPLITLCAIDIPLFFLLLVFRPKNEKFLPPPWPSAKHFFGVAIPTFVFLGTLVPVLVFNKPPEKTDTYEVVHPSQWVTVKPVKPLHQVQGQTNVEPNIVDANTEPDSNIAVPSAEQWPLLKSIDIADSLRSGMVIVLLYHFDCPACIEEIPRFEYSSKEISGENGFRFAYISVPPYPPENEDPIPVGTQCLRGKLDEKKKWIFQTPLVVMLQDGAVVGQAPDFEQLMNTLSSQ